jgi:hypothetical protein
VKVAAGSARRAMWGKVRQANRHIFREVFQFWAILLVSRLQEIQAGHPSA